MVSAEDDHSLSQKSFPKYLAAYVEDGTVVETGVVVRLEYWTQSHEERTTGFAILVETLESRKIKIEGLG